MGFYEDALIKCFLSIENAYKFIKDNGGISKSIPLIEEKTKLKWSRQTLKNILDRNQYNVPRGTRPEPKFVGLVRKYPGRSTMDLLRIYLNNPRANYPNNVADYSSIRYAISWLKKRGEI